MATYTKYEHFIEALCNKEIDAFGTTDTWKAVIHTDAPDAAADDELADLTQIAGTRPAARTSRSTRRAAAAP
jgi:hypothetical protein